MPHLRTVEVYPARGHWGTAWVAGDPDADAFAKVSRGISDAYSTALAGARVEHTTSMLVIYVERHLGELSGPVDDERTVVSSPRQAAPVREGFEMAAVRVVPGFATFDVADQQRVALAAVHAAARGMAEFRGLPVGPFQDARDAVEQAGHVFAWSTDWKSSPGRRWRARCHFRTLPDGFGRHVLEVSARDGSVLARSSEQVASPTMGGQRRAAATLRWVGRDRVEVVPCTDHLGHTTGVLAVDVAEPAPGVVEFRESHPSRFDTDPSTLAGIRDHLGGSASGAPRLDVVLLGHDPDRREVTDIGGGPTNVVPERYWRTLQALFAQVEEPAWQEWWRPADLPVLELSWWAHVPEDRLVVRRTGRKLVARIERTPAGFADADVDPADRARRDVEGLLAVVRRRMGLAAPPALR